MKIAILGSSSKLSNAIVQLLRKNYTYYGWHRDKNSDSTYDILNIKNIVKSSDHTIILIGNHNNRQLSSLLLDNVYPLTKLLKNNVFERHIGKIIYFSSANVYQLSKLNVECYKEDELILDEALNQWIKNTVLFLLELSAKNLSLECVRREIDNFVELNYPPQQYRNFHYELTKKTAEEVIMKINNSVIFRPGYCYGITDKQSILGQLVVTALKCEKIIISKDSRDFVSYFDLMKVLNSYLQGKQNMKIINIVTGDSVTVKRLLNTLEHTIKEKFNNISLDVELLPNKRKNISFSNNSLKSVIKIDQYDDLIPFENGINSLVDYYLKTEIK